MTRYKTMKPVSVSDGNRVVLENCVIKSKRGKKRTLLRVNSFRISRQAMHLYSLLRC
jgi:hypothetical protein